MAEPTARPWVELIADLRAHDAVAVARSQYQLVDAAPLAEELAQAVIGYIDGPLATAKSLEELEALARAYLKAAKGEATYAR